MSIAGWLPLDWQKAIVPLAVYEKEHYRPVGTGFLLHWGRFNCLITAKHVVLEENGQQRSDLFILLNGIDGRIHVIPMDKIFQLGVSWKPHHEKDLAATVCPLNEKIHDFRRFSTELLEKFSNIREGDDVFFLGFPLGITTRLKITPLARGGMVALRNDDETFLIDGNVFPGNSGSPVFFKPCPFEIGPKGLSLGKIRGPKLIGAVTSFIAYRDVAISQQTRRPRISFEENSGLATVLSIRFIEETLKSSDFQDMLGEIKSSLKETSF